MSQPPKRRKREPTEVFRDELWRLSAPPGQIRATEGFIAMANGVKIECERIEVQLGAEPEAHEKRTGPDGGVGPCGGGETR